MKFDWLVRWVSLGDPSVVVRRLVSFSLRQCHSHAAVRARRLLQAGALYQRLYNERSGLALVRSAARRLAAQLGAPAAGRVRRGGRFGALLAAVAFSFVDHGVTDEDIDEAYSLPDDVWHTLPPMPHMYEDGPFDGGHIDIHGQYYKFDPGRLPEEGVRVNNGAHFSPVMRANCSAPNADSAASNGPAANGHKERSEGDADAWSLVMDGDGFRMWRRPLAQSDGRLTEYRCIGRYTDVSAAAFFRVQIDNEYRKSWDKLVITLDTLDVDEDSGAEVVRWVTKFPYPLSPREYIFVRRACVDSCRQQMVIAAKALADHPRCPADDAAYYLRVTVYNSTMVIRPHSSFDQLGLDFVLTYVDDPQAPLPPGTQRWLLKYGLPGYLEKVREAAKQLATCADGRQIVLDE